MKYLIMAFFAAVLATGCKKENAKGNVTATGLLKVQEASFYQYGTHTIKAGNTTYTLRSSTISLDVYKDQTVTISGKKIDGYPLEGGPDFIEVTSVTK